MSRRIAPTDRRGFSLVEVMIAMTLMGLAMMSLAGAAALAYPDYEVIVVDDGSTDATSSIAERLPVRLIRTEYKGLSEARNAGLRAATGELERFGHGLRTRIRERLHCRLNASSTR
jgi:prepilin-type N-terminal cleavage/methylation domain-containing protein